MIAKYLILPLAAAIPFCVLAAAPAPDASSTLFVNCAHAHWPTRNEVARNLRVPRVRVGESPALPALASAAVVTADEVQQLQQFIRREGRRYCMQGASHVQVDFHAPRDRGVAMEVHGADMP